ncbi:hypothetical protein [Chitinophaga nivalis]|uniref:Tetratricopeptide repeat protein n=1 Tax=Chitinophaga nivalis TaxID=2991709 RepID=A0ABT3IQK3_9BACT|nr:hypothetical protein [Chitinophaga nivalis]MCW3464069.1 hypothetical protein [Chitinophaga nivalis]MCW3486241.1 hypothetical protein [Chitinophaga nivalis]
MTANRLLAHIFLKPALQQVDEATMEQLVANHPYFAAARMLLARKVYDRTGDLQDPVVTTALLYSGQPHHFYQFLTGNTTWQDADHLPTAAIPAAAGNSEPATAATPEPPAIISDDITMNNDTTLAIADFETNQQTAASSLPETAVPVPPVPALAEPAATHNDWVTANDDETMPAEPIKIFPLKFTEEPVATELTFQPLYTDDYFAYKRLKNPDEADELNDQGMAEMKSFTSWLREIKDSFAGKTSKDWYHQQLHRIYEEDEEPEVSETVEKMAMGSITFNNDIVSETLADIWVRQHQYENAIKIYQKLSLLNPDKNAYFAQKISELKSKTDKNKR